MTAAVAQLAPLVGQVTIHNRTGGNASCVAENKTFCFNWAVDNFDRYVDPTKEHLVLVALSVLFGFLIAFGLAPRVRQQLGCQLRLIGAEYVADQIRPCPRRQRWAVGADGGFGEHPSGLGGRGHRVDQEGGLEVLAAGLSGAVRLHAGSDWPRPAVAGRVGEYRAHHRHGDRRHGRARFSDRRLGT